MKIGLNTDSAFELPVKPAHYMGVDYGGMKVSLSDDGQTAMVKCNLIKSSLYHDFRTDNYWANAIQAKVHRTDEYRRSDFIFIYDFDANWNMRDITPIPCDRGVGKNVPKMTGDGNHIMVHYRGIGVMVYEKTESGYYVLEVL